MGESKVKHRRRTTSSHQPSPRRAPTALRSTFPNSSRPTGFRAGQVEGRRFTFRHSMTRLAARTPSVYLSASFFAIVLQGMRASAARREFSASNAAALP